MPRFRTFTLFSGLLLVSFSILQTGCAGEDCTSEKFGCYHSKRGLCEDYSIADEYNFASCEERFDECRESGGTPYDGGCPEEGRTGAYCSQHDDCYIPDILFYDDVSRTGEEMEKLCEICQSFYPDGR